MSWPVVFTVIYKLAASIGKLEMFDKKLSIRSMILSLVVVGLPVSPLSAQWTAPTAEQVYADEARTNSCPNCNHRLPNKSIYGWKGSPYFGGELGGCRCGRKSGLTWYNGYHHWPSPFSVLLDHGRHGNRNSKWSDTRHPRLRDKWDALASFRLLPPVRCDNGQTGFHCDPYGLLGESRRGKMMAELPSHSDEVANSNRQRTIANLNEYRIAQGSRAETTGEPRQRLVPGRPVAFESGNAKRRLANEIPGFRANQFSRRQEKPAAEKLWLETAQRPSGDTSLPSSRMRGPTRLR